MNTDDLTAAVARLRDCADRDVCDAMPDDVRIVLAALESAQQDAADARAELASESSERLKLLRRFENLAAAMRHLEQAYSNRHSPQHRAAALNSAQCTLSAIDAARAKVNP